MADLLTIEPRSGVGIATVMARRTAAPEAIAERLGVDLPHGPGTTAAGALLLIGTGPGAWLALREQAAPDFAEGIRERLVGLASVSDQSSGYSILRLSGGAARSLLQRGASVDLHPSAFRSGSAATTLIAHIGVTFWQIDEAPSYDVATFRSYATSFRHWVDEAAAVLQASWSWPTPIC